MNLLVLLVVVTLACAVNGQSQTCKSPTVVERRMTDDVRYASPFYVIALPNTPRTREIDNVCYSYFESENNTFFNIMSITYHNGSSSYYKLSKGDIYNRNGLAEARAEDVSSCVYHDYTLTPICNVSVFILYRCFIQGDCKEADIGVTPGVDVRVVLAASTGISEACRIETESSLRDTSSLEGGDYIILPQKLEPHCVTRYGDKQSVNPQNALGTSVTLMDESAVVGNRLGDDDSFSSLPSTVEEEQPSPSEKPLTSAVNAESEPMFLTQYTPQTTVLKKTYADAVKSYTKAFPKVTLIPGLNFFPYDHSKQHSPSRCRSHS